MATQTRLNITLTDQELTLLKSVAPHRKLSNFIKEAAVARAKVVHRQNLRLEIIQAYEADPEFQKQAGADWDQVSHEGWPEP